MGCGTEVPENIGKAIEGGLQYICCTVIFGMWYIFQLLFFLVSFFFCRGCGGDFLCVQLP